MYVNTRSILVFTALFAAAVATWLLSRPGTEVVQTTSFSPDTPLGYYLKDAVLLGMDDAGAVFYRVIAGQVEETAGESRLELSDVQVQYRESEDVQWLIEAEQAAAPSDRSYLDLRGNVRLTSTSGRQSERTVIEADLLRLEPEEFTASTDAPVSISFGERRLNAIGLTAHLKDDKLELRSDVHGQFIP